MKRLLVGLVVAICLFMTSQPKAMAQSTEERFHDLFVTAGYATAFGAALGAAALSFKPDPENHLRFIAIGASLGFISGSVLGSYVVFNPMFASDEPKDKPDYIAATSTKGITLMPTFSQKDYKLAAVTGGVTLFNF